MRHEFRRDPWAAYIASRSTQPYAEWLRDRHLLASQVDTGPIVNGWYRFSAVVVILASAALSVWGLHAFTHWAIGRWGNGQ